MSKMTRDGQGNIQGLLSETREKRVKEASHTHGGVYIKKNTVMIHSCAPHLYAILLNVKWSLVPKMPYWLTRYIRNAV